MFELCKGRYLRVTTLTDCAGLCTVQMAQEFVIPVILLVVGRSFG